MSQNIELNKMLTDTFRIGFTKRELISHNDKEIYLLVENDRQTPSGFDVLLIDNRDNTLNGKEYLMIGKNLSEEESLELAINFAKHCKLF